MTQVELNPVQQWALIYHYWLERRTLREDISRAVDDIVYALDPDRWKEINFPEQFGPHPVIVNGVPAEEAINDPDELKDYFKSLGQKRFVTGDLVPDEEGWV